MKKFTFRITSKLSENNKKSWPECVVPGLWKAGGFFGGHKIFSLKAFAGKGFFFAAAAWEVVEKLKYVGPVLPFHGLSKVI